MLRLLVVEDNILHTTLLQEQLTVRMGIPESNITYAFEGEQAIREIDSNMQEHLLDSQN
jgi:CheY-like chemotaxis protein